jgi:hypothetical protein
VTNRDLDMKTESRSSLSRQVVERQAEELKAEDILSPQRDPLAQVTCRAGDASCARAHASTLNRATDSQPSRGGPSLSLLQRQYGNRYAQRVLALSKKADGETEATTGVEKAIQEARGGGQELDSGVRAQLEPAFGADFSGVRVHADTGADALNRSLNARAFTSGQDVFFRRGAHELTHVVQQNGDRVRRKLTVGQPGDRYEQEADQVARGVMQQEQQPVQKADDEGVVRRQDIAPPEEEEEETPAQTKLDDAQLQRQVEAGVEEEEEPALQMQPIEERDEELQA